ncbi:MAG TPA: nuclear transport factor 2 family protein, partial [Gaiellaceae bacterium]|nr:nuclear transport factor 2 family protein [Gaiellaceae bacterium]
MSAEPVRRLWERMEARDWDAVAALLHEDVIVDWPATGERMRGRDDYLAVQRNFPEGWRIEVLRVVDGGEEVASEVRVEHEGRRSTPPRSSSSATTSSCARSSIGRTASPRSRPPGARPGRSPSEPRGLEIRPAAPDDHVSVAAVLDEWWGGRPMREMLPRLFFVHLPRHVARRRARKRRPEAAAPGARRGPGRTVSGSAGERPGEEREGGCGVDGEEGRPG